MGGGRHRSCQDRLQTQPHDTNLHTHEAAARVAARQGREPEVDAELCVGVLIDGLDGVAEGVEGWAEREGIAVVRTIPGREPEALIEPGGAIQRAGGTPQRGFRLQNSEPGLRYV